MWTKWLMVLVLAISACARISGLQNDLNIGYSYSQPGDVSLDTVPASLAYYIKIPAGQPNVDYYYVVSSGADSQTSHYTSQYRVQDVTSAYRQPQHSYTQDVGYVLQQQPDTTRVNNHFRVYTPSDQQQGGFSSQALPSVKIAAEFAPSGNGYQVNPRSLSNQQTVRAESPFRPQLGRTVPRTESHQDYQDHSAPSLDLVPPPYNPRETSPIESNGLGGGSATKQHYRTAPAMASLPTSYNAQLPFALGTVPIKFKPFPLKTHLRQNGILPPITSYQARESYKK